MLHAVELLADTNKGQIRLSEKDIIDTTQRKAAVC